MEIQQISGSSQHELFHELVVLFDKYRVFYKQASDLSLAERFLRARLENNESIIFGMFERQGDRNIGIGFTQLYPKYSSAGAVKNWILNDLYVAEAYRGLGVGKKLINSALEFAKEDGSVFVQLETAIDNYPAQQLYEAIGFKLQGPDTEFLLYKKML